MELKRVEQIKKGQVFRRGYYEGEKYEMIDPINLIGRSLKTGKKHTFTSSIYVTKII